MMNSEFQRTQERSQELGKDRLGQGKKRSAEAQQNWTGGGEGPPAVLGPITAPTWLIPTVSLVCGKGDGKADR